jgi:flagellar protein FliO/FliZ
LIALAAWLVRRFAGNKIGNSANRGRMPRLAVIDAAAVDGRRRLVLVRRDNVEHLLMIGGPTDLVVELNIVRAMPARETSGQRPGENAPRGAIAEAPVWAEGDNRLEAPDSPEVPAPEQPVRPVRPAFVEELRRSQSAERRAAEAAPTAFPEPGARSETPARQEPRLEGGGPPRPPRPDGPPRSSRLAETVGRVPRPPERTAPPTQPSAAQAGAEQELTEMAHRLEAALRRPAVEAASAESPASPEPAPRPPRVTSPPPIEVVPSSAPTQTPAQSRGFENLEDEMASLLGRPKSSSS